MTLMEGMWIAGTLLSNASTIGMLYLYKSMENSLERLERKINNLEWRLYAAGIPRMAKDTEVGE